MSILESIYATPAGKFVARKAGLSDPPKLRRGRVLPTGPVVLGELDGGGIARQTLELLGVSPGQPIVDSGHNADENHVSRTSGSRTYLSFSRSRTMLRESAVAVSTSSGSLTQTYSRVPNH